MGNRIARRHNDSSTVHPGSLRFTASARARTRAAIGPDRPDRYSFYHFRTAVGAALRDRRRMADVATESHSGDFHENRSRACPARLIGRSTSIGAARAARNVVRNVNDTAILSRAVLGCKGSLAFSRQTARDSSTSYICKYAYSKRSLTFTNNQIDHLFTQIYSLSLSFARSLTLSHTLSLSHTFSLTVSLS